MASSKKLLVKALLRSAEVQVALKSALSGVDSIALEIVEGTLLSHADKLSVPVPPDVLVVDVDLDDADQLARLQEVVRNGAGHLPVIATSATASVNGVRSLMRFQIADYLPQPLVPEDVVSVLEAAITRCRAAAAAAAAETQDARGPTSRVFSFIKAVGGVGSTTLAIQTAFELAKKGKGLSKKRVCLVDLDMQFGTAAIYLDLEPNLRIPELAESPERLDGALLESMMSHHGEGVDLLASPNELSNWHSINSEVITRLLEVTCQEYDYVVIDVPRHWEEWTADVLAGSDVVLVVTLLSVAGIRQARQLLDVTKEFDIPDSVLSVLLNRFDKSFWGGGLRLKEAERALGRKIGYFISNDYKLVSEALNHGVPIAEIKRRSKVEKQVRAMVNECLQVMTKSAEPAERGPVLQRAAAS